MASRAIWKGHLEIGQLVCPVALHTAASTSERVAFRVVNLKTVHGVRGAFVDAAPIDLMEVVRKSTAAEATPSAAKHPATVPPTQSSTR